jgi:hypothetical protein
MIDTIVDTVPGAITVYGDQIVAGDKVLDRFGVAWLIKASTTEGRRQVVVREDGWTDYYVLGDNEQVPIVPGDGDLGRNLDKASSGSVQGYIETGRYSSENEEREINPGSHA